MLVGNRKTQVSVLQNTFENEKGAGFETSTSLEYSVKVG